MITSLTCTHQNPKSRTLKSLRKTAREARLFLHVPGSPGGNQQFQPNIFLGGGAANQQQARELPKATTRAAARLGGHCNAWVCPGATRQPSAAALNMTALSDFSFTLKFTLLLAQCPLKTGLCPVLVPEPVPRCFYQRQQVLARNIPRWDGQGLSRAELYSPGN